MSYNFNNVIDRTDNQSIKWGVLESIYGTSDVLPLWVADMDFRAADEIIEAIKQRADQGIFGYTKLENRYIKAFTNWCYKRHHWRVEEEDVIYSPSVVTSLILLIKTFTNVGESVIIQPPVYGPFKRSAIHHEREVILNPMICRDGYYTMDFEDLEKKIDAGGKILIFCNPQNPVGRVWKQSELEQLAEIVIKKDILVISDEIHSDLMMSGQVHIPLASINEEMKMRTITCMSPSKTFNLAGLHSSVIVASHPKIKEKIKYTFETMDMLINNCFGQVAFEAAYNSGEAWLSELLLYIENNMDYVVNYISSYIPDIQVSKPEGTYLMWLNCHNLNLSQEALMDFMVKEAGLGLTEGTFFGSEGQGYMRLNVACPKVILEKAMLQLKNAVERKKGI